MTTSGNASAGDEPLPKVTPSLLRRAGDLCPRRLEAEYRATAGSEQPLGRARLRSAFLDAVHTAHADRDRPDRARFRAPRHLFPEERAVFDRAADAYCALYGERAGTLHRHDEDSPTPSPRRGLRIGGWVDVAFVNADGTRELRQLDLWDGRRPPEGDPVELESVWVAVLRVARWAGDGPLVVSWADLVHGEACERRVDLTAELATLVDRFDGRVEVLRQRIADPTAVAGSDCGDCRHLWRCPEHPDAINVRSRPRDLRPGVVTLTPTSVDAWNRCRRAWRNQYLLSLPASDRSDAPLYGALLHDVLRFVHERGGCTDDDHVRDVLDAHGAEERMLDELRRHAARCPAGSAESLGHEVTRARFHREPWPPFMATARYDALWLRDGVLEARDYKTGKVWYTDLAEDPRARLQAWVLAPLARSLGARLRLRYEYVVLEADEDPPAWEPDDDELTAVEEGLRCVVDAIRDEEEWHGVADAAICDYCRYASICPDRVS